MTREQPHARIELAPPFEADANVRPRESSGCGVSFLIACAVAALVVFVHSLIVTNFYRDMSPYNGPLSAMMTMGAVAGVPVLAFLIWLIRRAFR